MHKILKLIKSVYKSIMLNIIIDDSNTLYRYGVEAILHELFSKHTAMEVNISHNLTCTSVAHADIIIKTFDSGEIYFCQEVLYSRAPHSVVVGICDTQLPTPKTQLSLCLEDAIFIDRVTSPVELKNKIFKRWIEVTAEKKHPTCYKCQECKDCNVQALSGHQLEVAKRIFHKQSTQQISMETEMETKKISYHKRNMMIRFGLRSTFELHAFLVNYHNKYGF